MKIIAGLGNPGAKYDSTPHNVGFESVDAIACALGVQWEFKKSFNAMIASGVFAGQKVLLVKPQTFMNLSGDSIAPIVKYNNATAADLLVIHDDIDLPLGRLRVRKTGSAGGHNGIKSIIERMGTRDFSRLKIGVGKDKSNVVGYVLGKFAPEAKEIVAKVVSESIKASELIISKGGDVAMNAYNGWVA